MLRALIVCSSPSAGCTAARFASASLSSSASSLASASQLSSSLSSSSSSLCSASISTLSLTLSSSPAPASSTPSSSSSTPLQELHRDLGVSSFMPDDYYQRRVIIFRPSQNVMHQEYDDRRWRIGFDSTEKWISPLMGWTATKDPAYMIKLRFPTKEAAIAFSTQEGFKFEVEESHEKILRPKSYTARFKYRGNAPKASKKHPYVPELDEEKK